MRPHRPQHARLPCPSLSPRICLNSCLLSRGCCPTISPSAAPFLLLPSIFPSIRVFSSESALCIRWPKFWSFSFTISPSTERSGLISLRMDWLDLLAAQGTLKSRLQHRSLEASVLPCSAFLMVQLSCPYMTMELSSSAFSAGGVYSPSTHTLVLWAVDTAPGPFLVDGLGWTWGPFLVDGLGWTWV